MGISLKEVNYSYNPKRKGTIYALKNINLDIDSKDEFISIIGESGSGKSTLVSLLNCLKVKTSGTEIIDGVIIDKKNKKIDYNELRRHVGLVFQFSDHQLFEETILKDVSFAPLNYNKTKEEAIKIAKDSLSLVGIDETYYDRSPFSLSGGEKKLVSIAGILALESDIFIFDEPTAGLDPQTKNKLINLFEYLNRELHKTIILITHDMNITYKYSKRTIVVDKGEIIYDGDTFKLFNDDSFKEIINNTSIDLPDVLVIKKHIENSLNIKINSTAKSIDEFKEDLLK